MTPLALLLLTSPESRAQDTGDVFVSLPKDQVGEIFVDGQPSGATAPGTVQVSAGTHMIQVKGDCLSDTRSADVGANGVTRLDMELKPLGGFAQITATPAEAAVRLDGSLIETPAAIELSCGRHTLVTKADRYLTDEREFVVEMGGAYSVNVELGLEGFGSLSVIVTPIDAKVFLDGSEVPLQGTSTGAWTGHLQSPGAWFGNSHWSPHVGGLDELRIYDRALSSGEVAAHYAGTFDDDSGLLGHWSFDEETDIEAGAFLTEHYASSFSPRDSLELMQFLPGFVEPGG